jgi:O-antigen ligase
MRESSLVVPVALSALLFGAVYPWAIAVVALVTMSVFVYSLWKGNRYEIDFTCDRRIVVALLLLAAYPFFQLVPLPLSLLGAIHPALKDIVTISPDNPPTFHSISLYPFATEMEAFRLLLYLTVFFMAAFGTNGENGSFRIIRVLVIFGFILAVFGIIQYATWNGKIYWFKAPLSPHASSFGPFVNRNHFAGFIGMIIPFSLGLTLMSRGVEKKVMYAFLGIVMAIALFFTLSRGGIISFFAGLFVFSLFTFTRNMSKITLLPVFLFIFVLAVYLLFFGISSSLVEKFIHSETSSQSRFIAWQGTLSAFRDFPIFGSGFGTFQHIFKAYQPETLRMYWAHAHNDYLEFLLELGIVGMGIAGIFFFVVARRIMKIRWKGGEGYLGAALFASIATMAIHSVVDFNLHIPSNAMLFFMVLGLAVSSRRRDNQ